MNRETSQGERVGGAVPPENAQRLDHWYWVGALILTLSVRLYLFENYYTINNDGVLYIEAARHFWEGNWNQGLASFYPPLFPLMIAAAYPLVGDWELAGQFWPLVLGVFILFPLFALLRRMHGLRAAQVALLFYSVSPYLARLSLHVRSEIPYIFFLLLALYLLQRGIDEGGCLWGFFMGLSSASAYLIRSEGLGLILVGGLFLLYRGWGPGRLERRIWQTAFLFLGFLLVAAPYILYLRQDTGRWLLSRKVGLILSLGLSEYDPETEEVSTKSSDQVDIVDLIQSRPLTYGKKVFIDAFRSLGVYFEALHYSYLPFLFIGWLLFFSGRFWEKPGLLLGVMLLFYIAVFALLYVNRRYAVPLVPLSLGWVAAGYVALKDYAETQWRRKGVLFSGAVLVFFFAGTLPKTLQAIGPEKFYLREAGAYLRAKAGRPTILTNNARVAFYAQGNNSILWRELEGIADLLSAQKGDFLALDEKDLPRMPLLETGPWSIERQFPGRRGEVMVVVARRESRLSSETKENLAGQTPLTTSRLKPGKF